MEKWKNYQMTIYVIEKLFLFILIALYHCEYKSKQANKQTETMLGQLNSA